MKLTLFILIMETENAGMTVSSNGWNRARTGVGWWALEVSAAR